jgi:hypothetical protein
VRVRSNAAELAQISFVSHAKGAQATSRTPSQALDVVSLGSECQVSQAINLGAVCLFRAVLGFQQCENFNTQHCKHQMCGRISQIQKRPDKSRNARRKTVTNPETLPQIQKRWGVVGTNPETDHKSRNVGRVTATNPEARPKKSCFVTDPLTS